MSYESVILGDSPVVYWRLDEPSGTTAHDATGNGNDGTYHGSPTLGAKSPILSDPLSTAVAFNGAGDNQYVKGNTDIGHANYGAFVLEGWFYIPYAHRADTGDIIFGISNVSGSKVAALRRAGEGFPGLATVQFDWTSSGMSGGGVGINATPDSWFFCWCAFDGTTAFFAYSITLGGGDSSASIGSGVSGFDLTGETAHLFVGDDDLSAGHGCSCRVDEVAFYDYCDPYISFTPPSQFDTHQEAAQQRTTPSPIVTEGSVALLAAPSFALLTEAEPSPDLYALEVLSDSPVWYAHCEEPSGTNVADASGNGNDGTLVTVGASPTFGVDFGRTHNGFGVGGGGSTVNDYIDVLVAPQVAGAGDFTIEAIIRTPAYPNIAYIFSTADGFTSFVRFMLDAASGPPLFLTFDIYPDATNTYYTDLEWPSDGAAHHVALTYRASAHEWIAYLDAIPSTPQTVTAPTVASPTGTNFAGPENGSGFPGDIDEPALYDHVLSSVRIFRHALAAGHT